MRLPSDRLPVDPVLVLGLVAALAPAVSARGGEPARAQAVPAGEPAVAAAAGGSASARERAERLWAERHLGAEGGRADPERGARLVAAWEEAVAERPDDLDGAWRLLRALWFHGEHALDDPAAKQEVFGRGREVAAAAFRLLASAAGREDLEGLGAEERARLLEGVEHAAAVHYWAAVSWGLWGEAYGKLAAARQGVAERIRDYAEVVVRVEPELENGGGDRLLGRLHAEAPRVPFFTGWVSREEAVERLRAALARAPDDPFNRLYLGEALLDHVPGAHDEGRRLVGEVARLEPRPGHRVEDARLRALAAERLRE